MFETYILNNEGLKAVNEFKNTMAEAVAKVKEMMPDCKAKTVFLNKIEEGMFYGSKAVASSHENFNRVVIYPGGDTRFPPTTNGIKSAMESKQPRKRFAFRIKRSGEIVFKDWEFSGNQYLERVPGKDEVIH